MSIPIAHHEAREAHAALQDVREQIVIAVQLGSVPAVVRGHHDQRTRADRTGVSRRVHGAELRLGYRRIALVASRQGAAVAQKVLDRRQGVPRRHEFRRAALALESLHHRRRIPRNEVGRFGITLVRAAPPHVTHHRHRGRERPVDPGRCNFRRRRLADALDQPGVVGRAQSHVVRKNRGAKHLRVTVDRVDAE